MMKVQDIVGSGPRNPDAKMVQDVVEMVVGNKNLVDHFFQNFEGLAADLERQSRSGKGAATQAFRDQCAWQAANVRRFVAAVRKKLQP